MSRAVALFSGGLDSALSIRILQEQHFEVEALNIRTIYSCSQAAAAQGAAAMGVRMTTLDVDDDYLDVIRNPLYGYGRGINPCIDCRIYMCRMAKRRMEQIGACVVITGEVLGQRPMSQRRQHLEVVARRSGLEGRLLRPLSARLLPPTIVEQEGLVEREKLYGFSGRGRRDLIMLAEALGVPHAGSPSTGCALTEPLFAPRVRDLLQFCPHATRWHFELLNHGRHFRFDEQTKIVLGRNADENAALTVFATRNDAAEVAVLRPQGFRGGDALVVGRLGRAAYAFAGALILRYAGASVPQSASISVHGPGEQQTMQVQADAAVRSASPI